MTKCVLSLSVLLFGMIVSLYATPAQAVVSQSASSAMRNDIFVKDDEGDAQHKKLMREKEKRQKEMEKEQKKRQREAESAAKEKQKAALEKATQTDKSNADKIKKQAEIKSKEPEKIPEKQTPKASDIKLDTIKDSGPDYAKSYASKMFKTLSGYITIEQANLPRRISVTKGSTLQLNLKNEPDTFWNVEVDPKLLKIRTNQAQDGQWVVVIETLANGSSSVIMDYISTQTSNYKVLSTKKFNIWVNG